jgi:uncharacterized protein YlzI (FlbEa/FlbD family)
MRILNFVLRLTFLFVLLTIPASCEDEEVDPCSMTKWLQSKEYEIKVAVRLSESNPLLLGGAIGSQKPWEFRKMVVNGTIEKIECNDETTGPVNLGNTYITQEEYPEPIEVPITYWIGHVVYVFEFDNDKDQVNISLTVKVTMADGQSYKCTFNKEYYSEEIEQMSGELYYYIQLDVFTETWIKV